MNYFCDLLQGPRFSAANFAKFRSTICEFHKIPRHYCPQIPYIPRPVGVIVLTDNTLKYREFIITCNMKTFYIRPLMMKIHVINTHNYYKRKLTATSFYCFINAKIKKEPEKMS